MFPFVKIPQMEEILLPKLLDLKFMEHKQFFIKKSPIEHNNSFWSSWREIFKGRGIVTTFPPDQADYFFHKDKERRIGGFKSKFSASLSNTFAEYIFMNADVVTLIDPKEYFDFDEYKSSGIYITRDRALNEWISEDCPTSLSNLEPTKKETKLISSSLLYKHNSLNSSALTGESSSMTFKESRKHVAESGLMVIDKINNLQGTLTALMMSLNPKLGGCPYGDKEFYWLGQSYSGLKYEFEPFRAAMLEFP
ncbi:hypothetical protein C6P44_002486 [Monosporozyma unispora]|nr:hypothetical protein C6P44_002486 [Kazachstania unispora]